MLVESEHFPMSMLSRLLVLDEAIFQAHKNPRLHSTEKDWELKPLYQEKDSLLLSFLKLRRAGDKSVRVIMWGLAEEPLHPYSQNRLRIDFGNLQPPYYYTFTFLRSLRQIYDGDIGALIGSADEFVQERTSAYILRTIGEINEISGEDVNNPLRRRLRVELAEKILRLRAADQIDEGVLGIAFLRDPQGQRERDLIAVTYSLDQRGIGFHLLLPTYYGFPNQLQRLIDQGGGYNHHSRRRKSYGKKK